MHLNAILGFFFIFINLPLFAQSNSNQPSTPMFPYNQYELQISFKNSFITYENNPLPNKNYFYQAIEVVVFDEDQREFHPHAQRLVSPEPFIFEPQSLDSLDLDLDTELELPQQEKEKENYASLNSSWGERSSLYILPKLEATKCETAIKTYLEQQENYQLTTVITNKNWGNKKGLIWRAQQGKTRLDHYLVFGNEYNYLFVSSPYSGASGVIEKIILDMTILD